MSQSGTYKQYSRGIRRLTLEDTFNKGMFTEDNPLPDGAFKHIVNFNLDKDGQYIYPRPGKIIDATITTEPARAYLTGTPYRPATLATTTARAMLPIAFGNADDDTEHWDSKLIDHVNRLIIATPNESYTDRESEPQPLKMGLVQPGYPFINESATAIDGTTLSEYYFSLAAVPIYSVEANEIKALDTYCNEGQTITLPGTKDDLKYTAVVNDHFFKTIEGPYNKNDPTRNVGINVLSSLGKFKPQPRIVGASLQNVFYTLYNVSDNRSVVYPENSVNQRGLCKVSTYPNKDLPFYVDHIAPKELTPTMAVHNGFNMLHPTPSYFTSSFGPGWEVLGAMVYKDEYCKVVNTHYNTGDLLYFALFWKQPEGATTGNTLNVYYRPASKNEWELIHVLKNPSFEDSQMGGKPVNSFSLEAPAEDFYIKAEVVHDTDKLILSSLTMPFDGGNKHLSNSAITTKDLRFTNYDLTTATGMLSWKGRLILWGVDKAPDVLWSSAAEDPSYFPYDNGICTFDSQILYVTKFMDALLVVTPTEMYKVDLVQNSDGDWFLDSKLVVNNINITYEDTYSILTVKNMVFYKSGNYYYMLVPSTKLNSNGELNVAPVSKPINYYLDHFDSGFKDLLINMYNDEWKQPDIEDITLHPLTYKTFIDNDFICLDFSFDVRVATIAESISLSYILKYNVVQRTWTSDIYYSPVSSIELYLNSLVGVSKYLTYNYTTNLEGKHSLVPSVLTEDLDGTVDTYVTASDVLPNTQYIDTGFRDLSKATKKRMREIIFKVNNKLAIPLEFSTRFIIDNEARATSGQYGLIQGVDKTMQIIHHTKTLDINGKAVYNNDIEPDINDDVFALDESSLNSTDVATVRWKVSGKGYLPKLKLLSKNKKSFELTGIGWVARLLNAR